MKRMASFLTGLSLAVLLSVATAQAQYDGQKLTVNVPFEFTVGGNALPAGEYTFLRTAHNLFVVRDAEGHSLLTVVTGSIQTNKLPDKSSVKFAVVDGRHVLVQIWNDNQAIGSELYYGHTYLQMAGHPAIHGTVSGRR